MEGNFIRAQYAALLPLRPVLTKLYMSYHFTPYITKFYVTSLHIKQQHQLHSFGHIY